ncbi:hypothetical protein [Holzapfeliella floricola]|uniref:hypothetical protein n=1 Tax=Holzapfeliella floricola TaxID=679249 RepID=UPI000B184FD1|nr:hypothetical protein [Holzapfeliella floricola]
MVSGQGQNSPFAKNPQYPGYQLVMDNNIQTVNTSSQNNYLNNFDPKGLTYFQLNHLDIINVNISGLTNSQGNYFLNGTATPNSYILISENGVPISSPKANITNLGDGTDKKQYHTVTDSNGNWSVNLGNNDEGYINNGSLSAYARNGASEATFNYGVDLSDKDLATVDGYNDGLINKKNLVEVNYLLEVTFIAVYTKKTIPKLMRYTEQT